MSTIEVQILPVEATEKDVEQMTNVFKGAFGPDPLVEVCFNPSKAPPEANAQRTHEHLDRLKNDPNFVYRKAVDANNPDRPMLGVAVWYWVREPMKSKQNEPWGDPKEGTNMACYDATFGEIRRWRLNYFRERNQPFIYLGILTIAPDAQRQGIGGQLLKDGLKEADEKGMAAFLEASPGGLGLYKKFGWEEGIVNTINLKDYGGQDLECTTVGMVRPAGSDVKPK